MNAITQGTEIPNLSDKTLEKIVWYDPEELDFYTLNERDHSDAEINSFQRTIHDYNGTQPVVVDNDGNIIAGRGRVEAGYVASAAPPGGAARPRHLKGGSHCPGQNWTDPGAPPRLNSRL